MKNKYLCWVIRLLTLSTLLLIAAILFDYGTKEPFEVTKAVIGVISGVILATFAFEFLLFRPLNKAMRESKINITRKKFEENQEN